MQTSRYVSLAAEVWIGHSDKERPESKIAMPDTVNPYTKHFIAMRYWLLGKEYYLALDALEYASKLHVGKRKDGVTKEYAHQLSIGRYVKSISTSLEHPEETLASVFLHDVCEDCGVGFEEIEARFGLDVGQAVQLLTKQYRGHTKPPVEYYWQIGENKIASVVKGADRVHNIQTMIDVFTYEKQKEYIHETQEYIVPMLKKARRRFPRQEPAYENIQHVLVSQAELLQAVHNARGGVTQPEKETT
jgi:(p)ppGpp synthase/HD superfamily hydrolase